MVLYFSGIGNSRYAAQRIAEALGDQLLSVNDRIKSGNISPVRTDDRLVIVTPTYACRIPRLVENWLRRTEFPKAKRVWFVMTCGSETGNAAKNNHALCRKKQLTYMGTRRLSYLRIILPCSMHPKRRKRGRLLLKRSKELTVRSHRGSSSIPSASQ